MAITVDPFAFFDVTIGVTLIGLAVTASLFGVATAQVGWYYRHYPRDRRFLKMLVALVWSYDAFHLLLYTATMWNYLVMKDLNFMGLTLLPWESSAQLLCNACAIVTIQSFYSYRIWTLSQNRYLAALLVIFVCADFGLAFTLFMKSLTTKNVIDFIGLTNFDIALSSVTASTDVLLSATLFTLLALSRTGSVGANRLINKLVLYTINTGALTRQVSFDIDGIYVNAGACSFFAVVSLITVIIMPTTSVYVMFYYIGARLYSVSLLATLNARESLRIQAECIGHVTLPRLSSISRVTTTAASKQPVVVAIQHSSSVAYEDEDEFGVKEVYRRAPGHQQGEDDSERDGASLRDCQWEPMKLKARAGLPGF
ncbi:uncharacterized protein TRAVEDRAFT_72542 [Trametes versicolor FP-101664 SS1]|uniref:uncharacterized protein n=1 Tax=Trametes versicolor (strain FP-101664) TaxID=717944 RepID=UPI00046240E6|nr:uncharacterized protein TRAVEDRAFT_72542 [Trametes versicolor FP-101664 SS1]EIW57448.1 hypothetical protein TRAVEDRAFT_72542 [Trametes versicolor FP-101664 SS1]